MQPLPIPPPPAGRKSWRAAYAEAIQASQRIDTRSPFAKYARVSDEATAKAQPGYVSQAEEIGFSTLAENAAREQYNADLEIEPLTMEELRRLLNTYESNVAFPNDDLKNKLRSLYMRSLGY